MAPMCIGFTGDFSRAVLSVTGEEAMMTPAKLHELTTDAELKRRISAVLRLEDYGAATGMDALAHCMHMAK